MHALVIPTPEQGWYHMAVYKWLLESQKETKRIFVISNKNNDFMIPIILLNFEIKETASLKGKRSLTCEPRLLSYMPSPTPRCYMSVSLSMVWEYLFTAQRLSHFPPYSTL